MTRFRPRFRLPAALVLLTLSAAPPHLFALDPSKAISQYIQTVWTTDSGLPQTSVYAITQTTDGYLWVGTEQGLARFDGVRFVTYNHENTTALPDNYMHRLLGTRDGSLWIGTDSGLVQLKDGAWTTWTSRSGLSDDDIEDLAEGKDGSLWIGTDQGLDRLLRGKITVWHARDGLPGEHVSALRADRSGKLWIAMRGGLASFDGARFAAWTKKNGLPDDALSALAIAPDGAVWTATAHGQLVRLQGGKLSTQPAALPPNDALAMLFDRDGNLWMGFQNSGMVRLRDGVSSSFDNHGGLPGLTVESIFEDAEHNLWVGLYDGGLVELRDGLFTVIGGPEGATPNLISCAVAAGDGSIWASNYQGELNHILPGGKVRIYTQRDGLPNESIHSLLLGRDGTLWLGHRHGVLTRYRDGRFSVFFDPQSKSSAINGLLEDRNGDLWVATYGAGFARFRDGRFLHATTSGSIQAIVEAPDGAIWLGTDGDGALRYQNGTITRLTHEQGLISDHVDALWAGRDGTIWVGEGSGGLNRIKNGHITSYTPANGLFDSTVGNLVEDRFGDLWMGSDHGIFRVEMKELEAFAAGRIAAIHSVAYDTSDGLRSRETIQGGTGEGILAPDGRLLFPTLNGVAIVDPVRALAPPQPVPIRIEGLMLGGRPLKLNDEMRLGAGAGRLEIQFTALSFVAPTRIRFRYRLEGYDHDWVQAGAARTADFTGLTPGHYRFTVEAARANGDWDSQSAGLSITVLPPWYNTWLAWIGWVAIATLVTWTIVELRTRSLSRRRKELERLVAERTSQLEDEKSALAKARETLQIQATHDSLTGLWNRGAILEHLEREMRRARREGTPLTVVLGDLDHFKTVNDNHGHLCGDRVLREAATRMASCLRGYDVIGRYGGEEFLVLMPGLDAAANSSRIDDLLGSFASRSYHENEADPAVTCSFGVTVFRPAQSSQSIEDVVAAADRALYRAKIDGRNRATFAELSTA